MAQFFIDRPIFAWVVAIIVMLAGALSILELPVSQYPAIAPPTVSVIASYPGASAKTLEDTVTQVIEQRMTGLDGLRYMSASSDSAGQRPGDPHLRGRDEPRHRAGAGPEQAAARDAAAAAGGPAAGRPRRRSRSANFLLIIGLVSEDGSMTRNDISDYAYSSHRRTRSAASRASARCTTFGSQYAMRIWLDPDQLASYRLTPLDVSAPRSRRRTRRSRPAQLGGAAGRGGPAS